MLAFWEMIVAWLQEAGKFNDVVVLCIVLIVCVLTVVMLEPTKKYNHKIKGFDDEF